MNKELVFAALLLLAAGCAGSEKLSTSPSLPSSEGNLKCEKAENGNTGIDLRVKHLANPSRLTPPAAVYVVWMRPEKNAGPQNIGALDVDKNLSGRLKTVTAQKRFELFITAESLKETQAPTGAPLMWANCNR